MPATYPVYVDDIQITVVTGTHQQTTITSTGWYSADMSSYTYTGSGTFLGFSLTSGATVPDSDLEIGDTLIPYNYIVSGTIHLYSVATASNETYITSDIDLTSVANAIRTKGGTSASLVYPTGYISAINALPTGTLQSYKSVTYTSPGTATILPDSGYVGIEEISVEYSPAIYDGAYHREITTISFTAPYWGSIEQVQPEIRTYYADEGMIWSDFINSSYNTDGFYITNSRVMTPAQGVIRYNLGYTHGGATVSETAVIEANHAYSYTVF